MTWQRTARLVVAVIGVGCAVALVVLRRDRATPAPAPQPPATTDPNARLEGGRGDSVLLDTRTGELRGRIKFESSREYEDGRLQYDKVLLTNLKDPAFELWCDRLEAKGKGTTAGVPGEFNCSGHVRLETKEKLRVETDRATYQDAAGVVTMPGDVTFARGRLSGRSTGAIYTRDTETIELLDQASAQVAPDAQGKGAVSATSKSMTLLRGKKSLHLRENAKIVDETETLAADDATLHFTDDEQSIRFLELRGKASVTPAAAGNGAPEMHADSITLAFHPDGRTLQHGTLTGQASLVLDEGQGRKSIEGSWIDLYTGPDGRTLTRLDARDNVVVDLPAGKDTPARSIRAATLTATGDEKAGLKSARFDTNVIFEERGTATGGASGSRKGTSQTLVLWLNGKLEAIDKAEFRQTVEFTDGDLKARADIVEYRETQGVLLLRQADRAPKRIPNVTDAKVQVDALAIDLDTKTHNLKARGDVRTVTQPDAEPGTKRSTGLFSDKEPVTGLAEAFEYVRASGEARYTGSPTTPARLLQGTSEVIGDEVRLDDRNQNLDAAGRVSTTFEMTGQSDKASPEAKPTLYLATAAAFHYDDAKRTATYDGKGKPVLMNSGDGETEGLTMRLTLADEGRTLRDLHVEGAKGTVFAKIEGGYEAKGDVLDYEVATETYRLVGKPAKVKSPPQGTSTKCSLTTGLEIYLNRKDGSVRAPSVGGFPGGTSEVSCEQSLRQIR